jgi:MFS family permease
MSATLTEPPLTQRPRLYYGWVHVALAAVAMTATFPGRTHGLSIINKSLQGDLKIGDIFHGALNFWSVVLGAALCWPIGRVIDRVGTRITLTVVAGLLGIVVLMMSRVVEPIGLFISLTLTRALGQGALSIVSIALIGKWFQRRLGPAMGLFSVLLAVGFIATTIGVGVAVQESGWRPAWEGLGWALLLGLAPVGWLLARSTPEGSGLADPRELVGEKSTEPGVGFSLFEALRCPAFWVYTAATSLFNLIFSGFTFFAQGVLESQGFDANTYLIVMGGMTFSGLIVNLLAGWLSSRWPVGRLLAIGMGFLAVSLAVFPVIHDRAGIIVFGLALGGAGGICTVIFFTVYSSLFGRRQLGQIQGVAQMVSVVASALGPYLLAVCHEESGSQVLFFLASAVVSVVFGIASWLVPVPRPRGV